jgi:hypothetical protein
MNGIYGFKSFLLSRVIAFPPQFQLRFSDLFARLKIQIIPDAAEKPSQNIQTG